MPTRKAMTSRTDRRPYAYKYRDYVIRGLNADKPFDQFVAEQLAGDELISAAPQKLVAEKTSKS